MVTSHIQTIQNPKIMKNQEPNKTSNATITPKHVQQPTAEHPRKVTPAFEPKAKGHLPNDKNATPDASKKETKGTIDTHATSRNGQETKKTEERHATVKG